MKIATAPVNWNNKDVRGYRDWTPYPQIIDEMTKAGYSFTEWDKSMAQEPDRMRGDLKARGLGIVGGFVEVDFRTSAKRDSEIARALEIGRFLNSIGGGYVVTADSGDSRRLQEAGHVDPAGGLTDDQWKTFGEGLNELGKSLGNEGIRLVFHNHVGTYVETESEIERFLAVTNTDHVSWCLDSGHVTYGGGDTLRLLTKHGHRVGYVHLKDVDGAVLDRSRAGNWSFEKALQQFIFPPLGDGIARVPEVLGTLKQAGYDGWIVIEQDTTPLDPTENAERNRIYLEKLLES